MRIFGTLSTSGTKRTRPRPKKGCREARTPHVPAPPLLRTRRTGSRCCREARRPQSPQECRPIRHEQEAGPFPVPESRGLCGHCLRASLCRARAYIPFGRWNSPLVPSGKPPSGNYPGDRPAYRYLPDYKESADSHPARSPGWTIRIEVRSITKAAIFSCHTSFASGSDR